MEEVQEIDPSIIWKAFHDGIGLSTDHHNELREKRGFSDDIILEKLKFRTSCKQNYAHIESLLKQFPGHQLGKIGLATFKDGAWKPAAQYCGYGRTNRRDPETGEHIWDYIDPILIPYFDDSGRITTIRPHKGNPKRPKELGEGDESWQALHVYCPYILRITPIERHTVVITEGEFKAAALMQAGIAAVAFPGIHSIRNFKFRSALIELLQRHGVANLVIAFDNETKDDPALKEKYKPDPWDRYDALVYAKYTGISLEKEGFRCRLAILPEEWKVNGKADWDGALADLVRNSRSIESGTKKAASEFRSVIAGASPIAELDLFATEAERIVQAKLSRLFHAPLCPHGDKEMLSVARQIMKAKAVKVTIGKDAEIEITGEEMAAKLRTCVGRYYARKQITKCPQGRADIITARVIAKDSQDWATVKFCDQLLLGFPEAISNFTLRCDFSLRSQEGKVEYLVTVSNVHKERTETHVRLTPGTMAKLTEFRKWCNELKCTWAGGEKDLQNLTMDIQAYCAFREIVEIEAYGYHADTKMWKFGDRAFTHDGKVILPDKNNVFWYEGVGYQTDFNTTKLGAGFEPQGAPILGELDIAKAANAFILFTKHLYGAVGGYDGWLALGAILAYAVHPELHRDYTGAPGLWVTGRKSSGKSTVIRWLMRIYGFHGRESTLSPGTTGTFVARYLSKYSSLPTWFDEFDALLTQQPVQSMFKDAFGRLASGKATYDGSRRTRSVPLETTPVVSGETGTRDAATRSRYTQVVMLEAKSKGNPSERLRIMNNAVDDFRHLGHFLMKNRAAFTKYFLTMLGLWEKSVKVTEFISSQRDRWVAGVPNCAVMITAKFLSDQCEERREELQSILAQEGQFTDFTLLHGAESHLETAETSFISQFWTDIVGMISTGGLDSKYFRLRWVKSDPDNKAVESTGSKPHLLEGWRPALYMAYESVYLIYEQQIRMAQRNARLSRQDLVRELKREDYWIKPKGGSSHQVRFIEGEKTRSTCWAFDLTLHPFGSRLVSALRLDEVEEILAPVD